jgi:hypothetical protein
MGKVGQDFGDLISFTATIESYGQKAAFKMLPGGSKGQTDHGQLLYRVGTCATDLNGAVDATHIGLDPRDHAGAAFQ